MGMSTQWGGSLEPKNPLRNKAWGLGILEIVHMHSDSQSTWYISLQALFCSLTHFVEPSVICSYV